jgi:hypothetical protein
MYCYRFTLFRVAVIHDLVQSIAQITMIVHVFRKTIRKFNTLERFLPDIHACRLNALYSALQFYLDKLLKYIVLRSFHLEFT